MAKKMFWMGLESVYGKEIIQRGEGYIDNVNQCIKIGNFLYADVVGMHDYRTKINLETLEGECSCPYGSNCKHAVAAYLHHKAGKSGSADKFIEHLQKLSKDELIRLIVDNLPKNTEMALDFTIKNETNISGFVDDFISEFSYSKMRKAEKLIDSFSFRQLMRLIKFLGKHEYDGFEKLDQKLYEDRGYSYDDDNPLYDFKAELEEAMVKKISSETELKEAIKTGNASRDIIGDAEQFAKFKGTIKKHFSKDDYLSFLLMLKNPDLDEVSRYLNKENRHLLWNLPDENIELAERIGKRLQDKTLLFLVALERKDCDSMLKYFDSASNIIGDDYRIDAGKIIDVLMENKVKDGKIAKKLLNKEFFDDYSEAQLKYLAGQIEDFGLIERELPQDFPECKPLLERLMALDREKAMKVLCRPNSLGNQSLEDCAKMAIFVKNQFGKNTLIDFIESNRERLATSSHLKKRLKEEGIFVSMKNGTFIVEVGK